MKFHEALLICQNGVKYGSLDCARKLGIIFNQGYWSTSSVKEREATEKLGIRVDAERDKRYSAIYDALEINPDLRLNRLDAVLPLPPAALPEWSGIEDAIEQESNASPTY